MEWNIEDQIVKRISVKLDNKVTSQIISFIKIYSNCAERFADIPLCKSSLDDRWHLLAIIGLDFIEQFATIPLYQKPMHLT